MQVVTNFQRFPATWQTESGVWGETIPTGPNLWETFRRTARADLVIINCDLQLTLGLALLFRLMPWRRKPLVAVDLVLRKPRTPRQRLVARAHREVLKRVDHFIHLFRDLDGYQRLYGIGPERSDFVLFKCNLWERAAQIERAEGESGYVLCAGKSLRDFETFFDAVDGLPFPAAISEPDPAELARHGARFTRALSRLPANVRRIPDGGDSMSFARLLAGARVVVIPTLDSSLCASGISTYLDAMMLDRPVVISDGPGVTELLREEAERVPPGDVARLRDAICRMWGDAALRQRRVSAGRELVAKAEGEAAYLRRVLNRSVAWFLERQGIRTLVQKPAQEHAAPGAASAGRGLRSSRAPGA